MRAPRWGFVVLGLVLVALIGWIVLGRKPKTEHKPAPPSVNVAKAITQDTPVTLQALGSALAWQGVTVRTQVNGKLLKVAFREGTSVKAGDLLAEIDPAPYKAALLQAQGTLKKDQALLEEARLDLKRYQTLASQDSLPRQTLDQQTALVKQDEGVVMTDQGLVDAAAVNLRWCRITSPVTGRVGVRLVDPGSIVSTTDTTGLVIVNEITPIAVTFTVPQGDFQRLADLSQGFTKPLKTVALSQETGETLGEGEVSIADNKVDPATGTVALKARFENAGHKLWPGQFVNVKLTLQTLQNAVVVPSSAVNQGAKGAYVYVVTADGKASMRPVVTAGVEGQQAIIKSGIKAGDTVIYDGQLSVKPNGPVSVHGQGGSKGGSQTGAAS